VKVATADSSKGLGSGFADHQLTFTPALNMGDNSVSADFGLNLVGTGHSHDPYFFTDEYYTRTLASAVAKELDFEVDFTPSGHATPSDGVLIISSKLLLADRGQTRLEEWTITPGLTAGLVSSSSRWGAFVTVTYSNSRRPSPGAFLLVRPAAPRHVLGLGLSGSRR